MTQKIKFQLYEVGTNKGIATAGGVCYVATAGAAAKQAITDVGGSTLTNPRALTRGGCEFYVADSVNSVDLYIMAPSGQFIVRTSIVPGEHSFFVDTDRKTQVAIIPFSKTDVADATEIDTGFDFPLNTMVLPQPAIRVLTADSTEDIDVGLLSTETNGDADGFIDSVLLTTAGLVKATLLASADTFGALLSVLDSANAGDDAPEGHVVTGANATSITYTLSTGTDTGEGFIYLPYILMAA